MNESELNNLIDHEVLVRAVVRRVDSNRRTGEIVVYLEPVNGEHVAQTPPGSPMLAWYISAPIESIEPSDHEAEIRIIPIVSNGMVINQHAINQQREAAQGTLFS